MVSIAHPKSAKTNCFNLILRQKSILAKSLLILNDPNLVPQSYHWYP